MKIRKPSTAIESRLAPCPDYFSPSTRLPRRRLSMKTSCTGKERQPRPSCWIYLWMQSIPDMMPSTIASMADHLTDMGPQSDHQAPPQSVQASDISTQSSPQEQSNNVDSKNPNNSTTIVPLPRNASSTGSERPGTPIIGVIETKRWEEFGAWSHAILHYPLENRPQIPLSLRDSGSNDPEMSNDSSTAFIAKPWKVQALAAISRGNSSMDVFILSGEKWENVPGQAKFELYHALWTGTPQNDSWILSEELACTHDDEAVLGMNRQITVISPNKSRIEVLLPVRMASVGPWSNARVNWSADKGWSLVRYDACYRKSQHIAVRTWNAAGDLDLITVEAGTGIRSSLSGSSFPMQAPSQGVFGAVPNTTESYTPSTAVALRRNDACQEFLSNVSGNLSYTLDFSPERPLDDQHEGRFNHAIIVAKGFEHSIPENATFIALCSDSQHATIIYPGKSGGIHIWHQSSWNGPWNYKEKLVPGEHISPAAITVAKGPEGVFDLFWVAGNGQILHIGMDTNRGRSLSFNPNPAAISAPDAALRDGPIAAVRTCLEGGRSKIAIFFVVGPKRELSSIIWTGLTA